MGILSKGRGQVSEFQGCKISRSSLRASAASRPAASLKPSKPWNFETSFSSMRRRAVDDVQGSCYYQTVPRVKSGLPVYGSPVGCATCAATGSREILAEHLRNTYPAGSGTLDGLA